jgi:sugar phosphate isomerase/epimerase
MKTRRHFLHQTFAAATGAFALPAFAQQLRPEGENISFGLCTYMWGAEWDIPTLITNLKELGISGVELRVDHAHKVSPTLSPEQRKEVQQQFADGGIEIVGMGTNAQFDSPDKAKLLTNIDIAKQYLKLSHDIGGSGVKVKPDKLHEKEGISKAQTLEQIGKSLAELGEFAVGFGQEIRLEVHGDVTSLADIRQIMEIAAADNVRVCWNSNVADLVDGSIDKSFDTIKDFLGHTVHVRPLEDTVYPFASLMKHLVSVDFDGWVLMEAATKVEDKVKALGEQKALFEKLVAEARKV